MIIFSDTPHTACKAPPSSRARRTLEISGEQCALVHHALEFEQLDISPERGASGFIMGFFEALKYSLALPHARLLDPDFVLIRYEINIERGERVDIF